MLNTSSITVFLLADVAPVASPESVPIQAAPRIDLQLPLGADRTAQGASGCVYWGGCEHGARHRYGVYSGYRQCPAWGLGPA